MGFPNDFYDRVVLFKSQAEDVWKRIGGQCLTFEVSETSKVLKTFEVFKTSNVSETSKVFKHSRFFKTSNVVQTSKVSDESRLQFVSGAYIVLVGFQAKKDVDVVHS
jgi:hypothetical protein